MEMATLSFRGSQCLRLGGRAETIALREGRHPTSLPGPEARAGVQSQCDGPACWGTASAHCKALGDQTRGFILGGGRKVSPDTGGSTWGASYRRTGVYLDEDHGDCADTLRE